MICTGFKKNVLLLYPAVYNAFTFDPPNLTDTHYVFIFYLAFHRLALAADYRDLMQRARDSETLLWYRFGRGSRRTASTP